MEVWKNAHVAQPAITGPAGRGWKITECGLEIDWCQGDIMPVEVVDILVEQPSPEDEDDEYEMFNLCDSIQEEGIDDHGLY